MITIVHQTTIPSRLPIRIARPTRTVTEILAGMPPATIEALVQILAGPHRTDSATHNAQMCADVIEPLEGLGAAETVYHWALEVESDLGRVGAGDPADTVWSDMLWDYEIGLASLGRTATFVSELAEGLSRKGHNGND